MCAAVCAPCCVVIAVKVVDDLAASLFTMLHGWSGVLSAESLQIIERSSAIQAEIMIVMAEFTANRADHGFCQSIIVFTVNATHAFIENEAQLSVH